MPRKRLTFQCWSCGKTYTLLREYGEGNPRLLVACPHCGAEGSVDLGRYRKPEDTVYRGNLPEGQDPGVDQFDLPGILPVDPVS